MTDLAATLRYRLTTASDHPRFGGAPVDINGLTASELGSLWAPLRRALTGDDAGARELARSVLDQARASGLAPVFDGAAACEAMALVIPELKQDAISILAALSEEVPAAMAPDLLRLMGEPASWARDRYQCHVLARAAGAEHVRQLAEQVRAALPDAPIVQRELALLEELSWETVLALAGARTSYFWAGDLDGAADPALVLATEPAYVDFAEGVLTGAARHAAAIHAGQVPYAADGAFALDDAHVLARAARVAAVRDAPWLGDVMSTLLPQVCVAPTAAKTVPSQALAVALGHAVEAMPTPETVDALRAAIGVVRHAGVAKKIERNLKPAERALAARPDLALRSATLGVGGKRAQATLARILEAGFVQQFALPWPRWQEQLAATTVGKPLARQLIWNACSGTGRRSFMLDAKGRAVAPDGTQLLMDDATAISLWHPAQAGAECAQWQAQVSRQQLRQPLRQAFREVYVADTPGANFAGHVVSRRSLIGLARREGWRTGCTGLSRLFGPVKTELIVNGSLYPGMDGWTDTIGVTFAQRAGAGWTSIEGSAVDPVVFSEACRAVDLLISASAFALAPDDPAAGPDRDRLERLHCLSMLKPGPMAAMRRNVLASVFSAEIASGALRLSDRHAHAAGHAVHLSTARVTQEGSQVAVTLADTPGNLRALPWLPYDEVLLETLVRTVGALLAR